MSTDRKPWLRLAAQYALDSKVRAVSAHAELVYIRALALAKLLHSSDGAIEPGLLGMLMRDLPDDVDKIADELVAAGLWMANGCGYGPPPDTWRHWQTSVEERARVKSAARSRAYRARKKDESERRDARDEA